MPKDAAVKEESTKKEFEQLVEGAQILCQKKDRDNVSKLTFTTVSREMGFGTF